MSEPKNIHHINQLSVAAHSDQKLADLCCASSDGETSFHKIMHQTCDLNAADGVPSNFGMCTSLKIFGETTLK